MRSGSVEKIYASGHGGGVGGPSEVGGGVDVVAAWTAVRGGVGGSGGVGEEDSVLGAGGGGSGAFFASTAACGGEAGSRNRAGESTELGAGAGEE
jgi:hypothetical protein